MKKKKKLGSQDKTSLTIGKKNKHSDWPCPMPIPPCPCLSLQTNWLLTKRFKSENLGSGSMKGISSWNYFYRYELDGRGGLLSIKDWVGRGKILFVNAGDGVCRQNANGQNANRISPSYLQNESKN